MGVNVGYARCSTTSQDLTAQRDQLTALGVPAERVYLDKGLTGISRARPGLDQALAAVRDGDTFTVIKLDRLARSVPDALAILTQLSDRGVRFALGGSVYDWHDPMARMFLQILAVIAEFEAALIRQRTREGMTIARSRGKLRGKPPASLPPRTARSAACTTAATTPSPKSPGSSKSPGPPSTAPCSAPPPAAPTCPATPAPACPAWTNTISSCPPVRPQATRHYRQLIRIREENTALEEQRNGEWRYLEFLQVTKFDHGRHVHA